MFIFKCDGCYIQDFTGTEGGEADGEAREVLGHIIVTGKHRNWETS